MGISCLIAGNNGRRYIHFISNLFLGISVLNTEQFNFSGKSLIIVFPSNTHCKPSRHTMGVIDIRYKR